MVRIATRQGYQHREVEINVLALSQEVSRLVNGLIRSLSATDLSRLETRN
jgi:hypothetical protein